MGKVTEQEKTVQTQDQAVENVAVEETAEQGKRGRNPLTHADVMARIQNPNPIDVSFGVFAAHKFATYNVISADYDKLDADVQKMIGDALIVGGILGRWSTVVRWWNESDEQKVARESVTRWAAEQELAAKVAKLDAAQRTLYDAADDNTKSLILSLIAL